jgi:hypothetical protein
MQVITEMQKPRGTPPAHFASEPLSMFHRVTFDVFVKALDHEDRVMGSKLLAPEFLQLVAAGVIEAGEFAVVECGLASRAAVVAADSGASRQIRCRA